MVQKSTTGGTVISYFCCCSLTYVTLPESCNEVLITTLLYVCLRTNCREEYTVLLRESTAARYTSHGYLTARFVRRDLNIVLLLLCGSRLRPFAALALSRVRLASVYFPHPRLWLDRTPRVWLPSSACGASSATVLLQATALRHTGGGGGGGGALGFVTPSLPLVSPSRLLSAAATRTRRSAQAGHRKAPETSGACRAGGGSGGRASRFSNNGPAADTTGLMAASSAAGDAKMEDEKRQQEDEAFVLPRAPLPEIIVSNVPGSWAYDTMVCVLVARTNGVYDTLLRLT